MLPWSRADRFRLVFAAALVAAALAGPGGRTPLAAQEQLTEAVLLSGPTAVRGIPVYAPNRIPAFEGVYSYGSARGQESGEDAGTEARIFTVLYTREELLIHRAWSSRRCSARRLYQIPDYETFTLCYFDERGFFLFFFFPELQEPAYWCGFTDPFIERFLFLLNFVRSETDVPFPAILQVEQ